MGQVCSGVICCTRISLFGRFTEAPRKRQWGKYRPHHCRGCACGAVSHQRRMIVCAPQLVGKVALPLQRLRLHEHPRCIFGEQKEIRHYCSLVCPVFCLYVSEPLVEVACPAIETFARFLCRYSTFFLHRVFTRPVIIMWKTGNTLWSSLALRP